MHRMNFRVPVVLNHRILLDPELWNPSLPGFHASSLGFSAKNLAGVISTQHLSYSRLKSLDTDRVGTIPVTQPFNQLLWMDLASDTWLMNGDLYFAELAT